MLLHHNGTGYYFRKFTIPKEEGPVQPSFYYRERLDKYGDLEVVIAWEDIKSIVEVAITENGIELAEVKVA